MKCISIQQPWAGLILTGYKDIENRSWSTAHRGRLAIHAGAKMYEDSFTSATAIMKRIGKRIDPRGMAQFTRSAIVGYVDLIDIVVESDSPWYTGDIGWILANPVAIKPIPYRGKLGLFDIPDSLILAAVAL